MAGAATELTAVQGIPVPRAVIDPATFFRATRRQSAQQKQFSFAGLGLSDTVELLQSGVITALSIRVFGSVVTSAGGGSVATTYKWPFELIKNLRLAANGQSQLINCSGSALMVRRAMERGEANDRGVSRGFGGASPGTATTQGTLSFNSESWGLGSKVTAIADATYNYELEYFVPVAQDQLTCIGALFAQTASTSLTVTIDWASSADLFVFTGAGAATVTATVEIVGIVYSIPQGPNGEVIIPDLRVFHSLIQSRTSSISNGDNEYKLVGQGIGRQLQRIMFRTINNGNPTIPTSLGASPTYGQLGWKYGLSETPELLPNGGSHLRILAEKLHGADLGAVHGWLLWDFCSENALRDTIDEGAATELRLLINLPNSLALTNPALEVVQESLFSGAVGA